MRRRATLGPRIAVDDAPPDGPDAGAATAADGRVRQEPPEEISSAL
jgi:hypothetical protein